MSKMKELYSDMISAAMDCYFHGFSKEEAHSSLSKEFGYHFMVCSEEILHQAKQDIDSYHTDTMNSVYSYEERV